MPSRFNNFGPGSEIGHAAMLSWNNSGKKDPKNLWTELKNGVLSSFLEPNSETPIDVVQLDKLLSIGVSNQQDSFTFDLVILNSKEQSKRIYFTAATAQERNKWMEWILEELAPFSSDLLNNFTRCGPVFIKDGETAHWLIAWILVQAESKKLWIHHSGELTSISEDLCKVRTVSQMTVCDDRGCPNAIQPGSPLIINWSSNTRYIQSDLASETESWLEFIRSVALQSGTELEENQMTADDVPVLVECCIKFIETYGLLSEGIYRRSGVESKVTNLLTALKFDAWSFHISKDEYTEHDVANVLKRFIRTLVIK